MMAALFRSHVAFPESIYVESFTMEDGDIRLIEDVQGYAQTQRHFRLGDYRPMNQEARDLFDAASAARALMADGRSEIHDYITKSISDRLAPLIGSPTTATDAARAQVIAMVDAALANDVQQGRIRSYSVGDTPGGIDVKVTLPALLRPYQMTFELK